MLLMLPFEEQGARMLWTPVWSRVSSSARSPCWASPSTQPWCSPSDCRPWLQGKRKGAEAIVSSRTPGWVVSSPFPHPIPHFSQRPRLQTIWRGRQGWTTAKHCTESWGRPAVDMPHSFPEEQACLAAILGLGAMTSLQAPQFSF